MIVKTCSNPPCHGCSSSTLLSFVSSSLILIYSRQLQLFFCACFCSYFSYCNSKPWQLPCSNTTRGLPADAHRFPRSTPPVARHSSLLRGALHGSTQSHRSLHPIAKRPRSSVLPLQTLCHRSLPCRRVSLAPHQSHSQSQTFFPLRSAVSPHLAVPTPKSVLNMYAVALCLTATLSGPRALYRSCRICR